MHFKRVIPCLDVDAGRVVKGVEFVDIRDAGDPVELAAHYDREGADELVFLDITATHEKRDTIAKLARAHAPTRCSSRSRSAAASARSPTPRPCSTPGADKSRSTPRRSQRPELLDELAGVFGAQCVVLAIDAKERNGQDGAAAAGRPTSRGGRTPTGRDVVAWAREAVERGAGEILLTSMDRDGTSDGYDLRSRGQSARR